LVPFVPQTPFPAQALTWLWPSRLAYGKLAMLDGDPGLGKSQIALSLCACLTAGRPFPDASPAPPPANAIILNGEDGAEDTLLARLDALGADLGRVFLPRPEDTAAAEPLRLPSELGSLEQALIETHARLVVIDPVMAFLDPGVLSASDQSVRRLLYPLAMLAARHGCAVLLIRHLNKTLGKQPLYRGGGSIGFVGACRSAWLVAPDPDDPDLRLLAQVKNNLAPPQPSLAYRLTDNPDGRPSLTWLGTSGRTAAELLGSRADLAPVARLREEACDALEEFLLGGTHTSREVWAFARSRGLAKHTLLRAKQHLEVRSERVWAGGRRLSYWLLPGQELPPELAAGSPEDDLEPWLAPLRAKYPPPSPIDQV
jgi:hypothetical protein